MIVQKQRDENTLIVLYINISRYSNFNFEFLQTYRIIIFYIKPTLSWHDKVGIVSTRICRVPF